MQKVIGEVPSSKNTGEFFEYIVKNDELVKKAYETIIKSGIISARKTFNKLWVINVISDYSIISTFLPLLFKSPNSKIIFNINGVSPWLTWPIRPPPAGVSKPVGIISYRAFKIAFNIIMFEWVGIFKNGVVKGGAVVPGFFTTDIGESNPKAIREMGAGDPAVSGKVLVDVVEGK
ncbi:hypothetical protein PpBr36_05514 [Pyricularia pennisetigena]|uniref:hypothetical protein n=1 Tax=Pyricularia pennisetigena TaxID=1578925 RepID=UPI00114E2FD7|nr:hypothetical protein PpBr36_05514 [Pyricularia pennisetigena]TLS26465.1 hypothetical protein PpBr36_05514 [Pyricularia pennisetigena]